MTSPPDHRENLSSSLRSMALPPNGSSVAIMSRRVRSRTFIIHEVAVSHRGLVPYNETGPTDQLGERSSSRARVSDQTVSASKFLCRGAKSSPRAAWCRSKSAAGSAGSQNSTNIAKSWRSCVGICATVASCSVAFHSSSRSRPRRRQAS